MVAWQRLPIHFGGVSGTVKEVAYSDDDNQYITALRVDFQVPAMIAEYDGNMDGLLAMSEFPAELQAAITREKFEAADADKDGFLNPAELGNLDLNEDEVKLFHPGTISPVDQETAQELIGKELIFISGRLGEQQVSAKITNLDAETGWVTINPLHITFEDKDEESPVDLVNNRVMLDFGRTMRSGRELYMHHCMHCHGVTGDGNGPTAKYLSPLPRDYRQGIFKFISTTDAVKRPSRDDLTRTLRLGIPGTYMPSFAMLKDHEVKNIIEYVRWLSMRGEYEIQLNVILNEFHNKARGRGNPPTGADLSR